MNKFRFILFFALMASMVFTAHAQEQHTTIDTEKFYTLSCAASATSHDLFIADNGGEVNGQSKSGTPFRFIADQNGKAYYIQSKVSGKYIVYSNSAIAFQDEPTTAWTVTAYNDYHKGTVTFTYTVGTTTYYLNNYAETANHLRPATHNPLTKDNACSLWKLYEYMHPYTVSVTGSNGGGVIYDGKEYKNEETFDATLSLTADKLEAIAVEGYTANIAIDQEAGTITVTYELDAPAQPVSPALWDFTFNRTGDKTATATVAADGKQVEGVTAAISISPENYLTNGKLAGQNTEGYKNGTGILCINQNTTSATEASPNKYTLTITNNTNEVYSFDYMAVNGVALTSGGEYQGKSTIRDRYFKVTLGDTELDAVSLRINDDDHCSGTETSHTFNSSITIPSNETYTLSVAIYTDGGLGCFYGLTKISLGNSDGGDGGDSGDGGDGGDNGDGGDSGDGGDVEVSSEDALPGDGTLRFYRLAIPVTVTSFETDLQGDYAFFDEDYQDKVIPFWQDCEDFVNEVFIPLGMCFDVVMDKRLVMTERIDALDRSEALPEIGNCTNYINNAIDEDSYDIGMWVTHREIYAENTGLSVEGGAYISSAKGSGYAMTDKWVVAHEIGHMFGAPHTTTGEGSLMDSGGDDFFAYPSIKIIRDKAKGAASYHNVKVANNAPCFDAGAMKKTYRIPQGACLSIDVQATDTEGHRLLYTAIGCSSANVGSIIEGGTMPHFASFVPQESNVINYQPIYTADINYDTDFYVKDGTSVPEMDPGTYALSILVNDVPAKGKYNYASLQDEPFYSTYAIWEANVEIVSGTAFNATLSPAKTAYTAGEQVTVSWGVNSSYFTADSRVRISLSTDYGKTFSHVLAESVPARDGQCTVTMPNVNVGTVDVDFTTAVRQKAGGIIKVEEIGGAAYTLTTLDPSNNNSFTITGGADEPKAIEATISKYEIGTFYANEGMTIPSGVTAYVATTTPEMNGTEGTITMSKIEDGIIPARTGAVIRGEQGTYTFTESNAAGTAVSGNLLVGYAGADEYTHVALPTDGSTVYVLTTMDEVAAFYRKEADFKLYNNKAYLQVPTAAQNARSLTFRFGDDGSTGLAMTTDNNQQATVIYDLMGRRVTAMEKGKIYIVNGKKVVIR